MTTIVFDIKASTLTSDNSDETREVWFSGFWIQ